MSDDPYQAPSSIGATDSILVDKNISIPLDVQTFVTSPDSILLASA